MPTIDKRWWWAMPVVISWLILAYWQITNDIRRLSDAGSDALDSPFIQTDPVAWEEAGNE